MSAFIAENLVTILVALAVLGVAAGVVGFFYKMYRDAKKGVREEVLREGLEDLVESKKQFGKDRRSIRAELSRIYQRLLRKREGQ